MNIQRRKVIKLAAFVPFLIQTGIVSSEENKKLLAELRKSSSIDQAFKILSNNQLKQQFKSSSEIIISHPEIQRYGNQTPISIETNIENVERIYCLVEANPAVFAIELNLAPEIIPKFELNIKVRQNSNIYAVIYADQKWYYQKSHIVITIRGC